MARGVLGLVALAGMLSGAFVVAVPAHASDGDDCVVLLQPGPIDPSGAILATPVDLGCYPTYAKALAVGSSGAIDVPDATTPATLTDATLAADTDLTLVADVLIGTEWTGTGYAGSSKSYFAAVTCSTGIIWDLADLGSWNNTFSSGKGFGGCDTNKKFQNVGFGGTVVTCTPNCTTYGSIAGSVSSLRWKP